MLLDALGSCAVRHNASRDLVVFLLEGNRMSNRLAYPLPPTTHNYLAVSRRGLRQEIPKLSPMPLSPDFAPEFYSVPGATQELSNNLLRWDGAFAICVFANGRFQGGALYRAALTEERELQLTRTAPLPPVWPERRTLWQRLTGR